MAKINENEKKLLIIFGAIAFLAANVFGYLLFSDIMKGIEAQEKLLKDKMVKLNEARDNAGEATSKEEWMARHFKSYPSDIFRETYLDGLINSDLTAGLDVDILKPSVLPTDFSGLYAVRSRFRVNVKGKWSELYKFIERLQKPGEFRFVPRISLTPKKNENDDSEQLVEVQVELEKWWPKPDEYIGTDENAVAQNEQPGDGAVNVTGGAGAATPSPAPAPAAPSPADSATPASTATPPDSGAAATPPADNSPKPNS